MAYEVLFTISQGGQLAIPLKTTLAKLKKQKTKEQKAAISIICNAGYREHTAPLFS
jgi:hypothetical protein